MILAGVTAAAGALFGLAVLSTYADRDWHAALAVDGVATDRATVRDRVALVEALLPARTERLSTVAANLDPATAAAERARLTAIGGSPLDTALGELTDETLLEGVAASMGVTITDPPDPSATVAGAFADETSARVRVLRVSNARPPSGEPDEIALSLAIPRAPGETSLPGDSLEQLAGAVSGALAMREATPGRISSAFAATGWAVEIIDTILPASGPVDAPIPPLLVARLRQAEEASVVVPVRDGGSVVGAIALVRDADRATWLARAATAIADAKVPDAALRRAARAIALRRAVRERLVADWTTTPLAQVRGGEAVIGGEDAITGDPVEAVILDALRPADLPRDQLPQLPAAYADARLGAIAPYLGLAEALRALPRAERGARFAQLVAAAVRYGGEGADARSGSLPALALDRVDPIVAAATRDADPGSIAGPILTRDGPVIYLVRGHYRGPLDERTGAALAEALAEGADPVALTRRLSSEHADRGRGGPWRSRLDAIGDDRTADAIGSTTPGFPSNPVVLDGTVTVLYARETRTAAPDPDSVLVASVDGLERLLESARVRATIAIDPDPLGDGSGTAAPSGTPGPVPSPWAPTPMLPSIPPRPARTP